MAVHGHHLHILHRHTFISCDITHLFLIDSAGCLHLLRYDVLQPTATVGWLHPGLTSQQLGQHILREGCPEYYRRKYPLNRKVIVVFQDAPVGFKGHVAREGQEEGSVYPGAYHTHAPLFPIRKVFEMGPHAVVVPQ